MSESLVLALDTSTSISVGLARGTEVLARKENADRMQQVEQLMPVVSEVLESAQVTVADLTAIAIGLGPGPFTGLRVGIATARVLAAVSGIRMHGVCSLDVLAAQWVQSGTAPASGFVIATDARRKELYWARYDAVGLRIGDPQVSAPELVADLPVAGPGADLYADRVQAADGPRVLDASVLAASVDRIPSAGTEPLYLRRPDAAEPARRKSVLLTRRP